MVYPGFRVYAYVCNPKIGGLLDGYTHGQDLWAVSLHDLRTLCKVG